MTDVVSRVRKVQPDGRVQVIQVVSCDRSCEDGALHLHLEVVENGNVSYVGMLHGDGIEAIVRSGRFMRILLQMAHGMDVTADALHPGGDDGEVRVLPGTPTGIA